MKKRARLASRSTLPIEEWKAEQQLKETQTRAKQFLSIKRLSFWRGREQRSANSQVQLKQLGLDRDSQPAAMRHLSQEVADIELRMASLILAQDKRWRRA